MSRAFSSGELFRLHANTESGASELGSIYTSCEMVLQHGRSKRKATGGGNRRRQGKQSVRTWPKMKQLMRAGYYNLYK